MHNKNKNKKYDKNMEYSEELLNYESEESEEEGILSSDEEYETNVNPDDYE